MHLAELQSINLQQAADRLLDGQHVAHKRPARDQRRAKELRLPALHMHRPIVTEAHHVGDAASVAAIGFVGTRRQEPLRMSRLNADRREAGVDESAVEPFPDSGQLRCRQVGCSYACGRAPLSKTPVH